MTAPGQLVFLLTVEELISDAAALVNGTGEDAWRIADLRSAHSGA